ncbi:hypothetical protein AB0I68_01700 [Streptomyces sp. NPDC050448]|uniref:hypothetical protein n=1 Tax=Streptomyces sp. NPDC050448 TaxID=3155404 RepID=UPI00343A504E
MALRIHDGAFSGMDLTARHPSTGELLSTVKSMVQTLAAAGERSIAALARDRDVSRGAIRSAVADLLPEYTPANPGTPAPELSAQGRVHRHAAAAGRGGGRPTGQV